MDLEEIESMIDDCFKRDDKLTDWEGKFIDSISKIETKNLSPKQIERLEIIWERIT